MLLWLPPRAILTQQLLLMLTASTGTNCFLQCQQLLPGPAASTSTSNFCYCQRLLPGLLTAYISISNFYQHQQLLLGLLTASTSASNLCQGWQLLPGLLIAYISASNFYYNKPHSDRLYINILSTPKSWQILHPISSTVLLNIDNKFREHSGAVFKVPASLKFVVQIRKNRAARMTVIEKSL